MGNVIVSLLPLFVGAAVVPIWIIMVLFLLRGEGGLRKGAAFALGGLALRVVQGVFFGYVFGTAEEANPDSGHAIIVATLLLIVGILMLITAFRTWHKEEDPDAPPPRWMAAISGLSALKAFGMGALLVAIAAKQWVFTLSAIGTIGDAGLGQATNVILFLFYALAAQSLVIAPVLFYAAAPARAAKSLDAASTWLERYNRLIVTAISLIFGLFFVWKGITGLLG